MPISAENMPKYPGGSTASKEWKAIRAEILHRASNRCEECGVDNASWRERSAPSRLPGSAMTSHRPVRIVLAIAHLNHDPSDNRPENLAVLCQRCHNRHDAAHRAANRRARRTAGKDLFG